MLTAKEFSEASICQTLDHPQKQYQYFSFNNYPCVIKTDINTVISLHLQVSRSFPILSMRSYLYRCLQSWQLCLFPTIIKSNNIFLKTTVCEIYCELHSNFWRWLWTCYITNPKPLSQESHNFTVSNYLHTFFVGHLNKVPSNMANQTMRIKLVANYYSLTPIHWHFS